MDCKSNMANVVMMFDLESSSTPATMDRFSVFSTLYLFCSAHFSFVAHVSLRTGLQILQKQRAYSLSKYKVGVVFYRIV